MNKHTFNLSLLSLSILTSFGAYAAPTTITEPCDNSGTTTCQKEVVRDEDNKTVHVVFTGGNSQNGYAPSETDFSHTFINNANIDTTWYAFSKSYGNPFTKDIHLENNGRMHSTGASTVDFQWERLNAKGTVNNRGTISSSRYGWSEYAVILKGDKATSEFTLNNLTPDSRIEAHHPVGFFDAKSADIVNEGTIKGSPFGIRIREIATVNITNTGTIESNLNGNNAAIQSGGNVTLVNQGTIVNRAYENDPQAYAILTTEGNSNITSNAGKILGAIKLQGNNNTLTLAGTDATHLTAVYGQEDGSDNTFTINQNLTGSSDPSILGQENKTLIANWNTINIGKDQAGRLNLIGDLSTSLPNNSLNIGSQGTLALVPAEANVGYNVVNAGTITLVDATPPDSPEAKLTIKGNYEGQAGSKVLVKSVWNNPDVQKNDLLVIEGNATGKTTVAVAEKILGDVTVDLFEKNGMFNNPVITVQGDDSGVFSGSAPTANAAEAQLARKGNSYYWTLKAIQPVDNEYHLEKPTAEATGNGVTVETPVYPLSTFDIISQPVVGYVQQPFINTQMGLAQLGKLHERVGEQRNVGWENGTPATQVWGRISHDVSAYQGKNRFGSNVKSGFVQFGRDIGFKLNDDKSQQHTGLTFTYGWAHSKFFDKYRAEDGIVVADKFTGSAKSNIFSLGGYHTYYSPTGAYVDVVGQASWLQNHYRSGSQVKQNGYGIGAAVEVGKPFALLHPQVTVEPQAQLSYQRVWLNGFNDGVRQVKKAHHDSLVGRLGVRVNWAATLDKNSPQLYFTANLLQTLKGRESAVTVGRQQVAERFGNLAAEFGLGGQFPITQNLSLYGDVRHAIGLQDSNKTHRHSTLSKESYNGRIGIRYTW